MKPVIAPPLDVTDDLVVERARLLDVLSVLGPDEWSAPTECPAWDVKGIALHILGDDFSLLSRQRDDSINSLVLMAADLPGADFRTLLNEFNERWVHMARFFSTELIIDLLRVTGDLTVEWYRTVPPDRLGEPVIYVGLDPAPYWMIAAREYVERWVHLCQITRATERPVPDEPALVVPVVAAMMRGFPQVMAALGAAQGSTITVEVAGTAWSLRHDPTGWVVYDGRPDQPTVEVAMTATAATGVFSRALTADAVRTAMQVTGEPALAGQMTDGLAVFFGRH